MRKSERLSILAAAAALVLFLLPANPLVTAPASAYAAPPIAAMLIPSRDGKTVYDTRLHVNWLANANLAGSRKGKLGISTVNHNGSMDFITATQWLTALNTLHGTGFLGHSDWILPTMPLSDTTCLAAGPSGNFGYSCQNSDLGSLYYHSLGLEYPNTAVPISDAITGPFVNFQPYLYWSDTASSFQPGADGFHTILPSGVTDCGCNGYNTFSFNTGWHGSNVDNHYMYVLPMLPGKPISTTYSATGVGTLEKSADGQTVYDPDAPGFTGGVTWLANADLAMTQTFSAQCTDKSGVQCINPDGSMSHTTALAWLNGLNTYEPASGPTGWLGQTEWQLPPLVQPDHSCQSGYDCTGDPLGHLYYQELGLTEGHSVVPTPNLQVGPFKNVQPYLYWAICQPPDGPNPCANGEPYPVINFEDSFSFGNGFEGTDLIANSLYVLPYYPETAAQAADTTAPATKASVSGPKGSHGWYTGASVVTFSATDHGGTGVYQTEYSLNNGTTWIVGTSVSLNQDGAYIILYHSIDYVGNIEPLNSLTVKVDSKPPTVTENASPHTVHTAAPKVMVTISGNISDQGSGIDPSTLHADIMDPYSGPKPPFPITVDANGDYSFVVTLSTSVKPIPPDERVYHISVSATDFAGNTHSKETKVVIQRFIF